MTDLPWETGQPGPVQKELTIYNPDGLTLARGVVWVQELSVMDDPFFKALEPYDGPAWPRITYTLDWPPCPRWHSWSDRKKQRRLKRKQKK